MLQMFSKESSRTARTRYAWKIYYMKCIDLYVYVFNSYSSLLHNATAQLEAQTAQLEAQTAQ